MYAQLHGFFYRIYAIMSCPHTILECFSCLEITNRILADGNQIFMHIMYRYYQFKQTRRII